MSAMQEPSWRAEEAAWHEQESVRFQGEVANDPSMKERADQIGERYLKGLLHHERLTG
jgi:hypothetical protein